MVRGFIFYGYSWEHGCEDHPVRYPRALDAKSWWVGCNNAV